MMKKILKKSGFTLVEMLVAMSIFMIFVGVLINSYTSIVRYQREANLYRVLYSDSRRVFDQISESVKNNAIYYPLVANGDYISSQKFLILVSKDGKKQIKFSYEPIQVGEGNCLENCGGRLIYEEFDENGRPIKSYPLVSPEGQKGVRITEFNVFVSPSADPYRSENITADALQFQPKVTIFARLEKDKLAGTDRYGIDLQTTVSSRFYSNSPVFSLIPN